ncbi:MAG: hypothetical protein KAG66_02170, partial [Methylococcales bacterium]|nr:hypothetical protein [Methylococcales bacterium]
EIISSERALIYDSNSWGGRLVMSWVEKQIPPERILCELDALEAIAVTVSQGVGFSIIPHWRGLAKMGPLRRIPLPEITHKRELVLLHRHQSPECLELLQS